MPVEGSGHYSGYKIPGKNIYVADLSGQVTTVPGLRQNGLRMIRARCVSLPKAAFVAVQLLCFVALYRCCHRLLLLLIFLQGDIAL